jgi:nicotinate-nucleotide adenylyltransferase
MKSIALFGGSFDPVHLGHVQIVEYCLENFDFSRIDIIPNKVSPFKEKNIFTDAQRLLFLKKVFDFEKVCVNTLEIERESASYTALTIKQYKKEFPETKLYMIIGADHINDLDQWHDFEFLQNNLSFIVFNREAYSTKALDNLKIDYQLVEDFDYLVSSTQIKEKLQSINLSQSQSSSHFDGLIPDNIQGLLLKYYLK